MKWVNKILNQEDCYKDLDKKAQQIFDLVSPFMKEESKKYRKRKLNHILKMDKNYWDKEVNYFNHNFLDCMYDICDEERIRVN